MGGFTDNPSGVRKVLAILLVLFAAGAAGWCSKSEAAEGLSVGFGKAAIGSEVCFGALLLTQEVADRRWLATLSTHGEGHCRELDVRANLSAGILRTTPLGKFSVGFGAALRHHGDRAVGPKEGGDRPELVAQIILRRYLFGDRIVLDLLHQSTGGAAEWNPGLNALVIGVRL